MTNVYRYCTVAAYWLASFFFCSLFVSTIQIARLLLKAVLQSRSPSFCHDQNRKRNHDLALGSDSGPGTGSGSGSGFGSGYKASSKGLTLIH
jgi:hypothetical protein